MKSRICLAALGLITATLVSTQLFSYPMYSCNYKRAFVRADDHPRHYCSIDHTNKIRGYDDAATKKLLTDYVERNNLTFSTTAPAVEFTCSHDDNVMVVRREADGILVTIAQNIVTGRRFADTISYTIEEDGRKMYFDLKHVDFDSNDPAIAAARTKLDAYIAANPS